MKKHLLTDTALRRMPSGEHHDGGGLYCVIRSETSASWHLRYTVKRRPDLGRQKIGLGSYPEVSLADARAMAERERSLAAKGIDPAEERRAASRREMTVEQATQEYFDKKKASLKGGGEAGRWWSPIRNHTLPAIGNVPVSKLTVPMIVERLGKVFIEKPDTGNKVFFRLKEMLEYVAAENPHIDPSIVDKAKVQLPRKKVAKSRRDDGHQPALHWQQVPKLWVSLPNDVVGNAMGFYLLTLPRVSNVCNLTWHQIDLERRVWNIPAEGTKSEVAFAAPLTDPAMEILRRALRNGMEGFDLVFPNPRARKRPPVLHVNALRNYLQNNNWQSTTPGRLAVAHGLRATFTGYVVSQKICDPRLAEMSIQHEVMSQVEKAYNREDLLDERRTILDRWAEHVVSLERSRAKRSSKLASLAEPTGDRTVLEAERWARGDKADSFNDQ